MDHPTRLVLERLGLADELFTQGQPQDTCELRAGKRRLIIPYARYSDGIGHRVYPQHLLVRDLVEAFVSRGGELRFQTEAQHRPRTPAWNSVSATLPIPSAPEVAKGVGKLGGEVAERPESQRPVVRGQALRMAFLPSGGR